MSSFNNSRGRGGDLQDSVERGVWGTRTDAVDGSYMSVRGTATLDEEVPVINFGYSFNLPPDSNAEVIMFSLGSDPYNKVAMPTLPRDRQRQWAENTGGIQSPDNKERFVEFNPNETFLKDGKFVVGSNREVTITVDGANVVVDTAGDVTVNSNGNAQVNTTGSIGLKAETSVSVEAGTDMTLKAGGRLDVEAGSYVSINGGGDIGITASGGISLDGADLVVSVSSASFNSTGLAHNGTNVGDDHTHGGVDTGAGNTQGPN